MPVERQNRVYLAAILASVIVLAFSAWYLTSSQGRVEFLVHDVVLLTNRPELGETELRLFLIVRNSRPYPVFLGYAVLDAWDPDRGTGFDNYVHDGIQVEGRQTWSTYHVSILTGHWSEVALRIRVLTPTGWWEAPLTPEVPVVFSHA